MGTEQWPQDLHGISIFFSCGERMKQKGIIWQLTRGDPQLEGTAGSFENGPQGKVLRELQPGPCEISTPMSQNYCQDAVPPWGITTQRSKPNRTETKGQWRTKWGRGRARKSEGAGCPIFEHYETTGEGALRSNRSYPWTRSYPWILKVRETSVNTKISNRQVWMSNPYQVVRKGRIRCIIASLQTVKGCQKDLLSK